MIQGCDNCTRNSPYCSDCYDKETGQWSGPRGWMPTDYAKFQLEKQQREQELKEKTLIKRREASKRYREKRKALKALEDSDYELD